MTPVGETGADRWRSDHALDFPTIPPPRSPRPGIMEKPTRGPARWAGEEAVATTNDGCIHLDGDI